MQRECGERMDSMTGEDRESWRKIMVVVDCVDDPAPCPKCEKKAIKQTYPVRPRPSAPENLKNRLPERLNPPIEPRDPPLGSASVVDTLSVTGPAESLLCATTSRKTAVFDEFKRQRAELPLNLNPDAA